MTNATYFHRLEYIIPKSWFYNPSEVIKITLHFAPKNIVIKYDISFDREIEIQNEIYLIYLIKIYSSVGKLELQEYLNFNSTRIEKWIVK